MKVAVLVSGGVDSAVALRLLRAEGRYDLTACYLKVWLEEEVQSFAGDCPWEEDLRYVRATCEAVGVPLQIVSLQTEYYDRVVEYALSELRLGRTPSPDIFCNRRIKFGAFFDRVDREVEYVASGHYARVDRQADGGVRLRRAPDAIKDQTYFLSHLTQDQLSRALFPIGHLTKADVRRLADGFDLPSRARPDSQGICFLGKIDYRQFIEFHLGARSGAIVDADSGRHLGDHRGHWFYTIGQRFGLGLSGGPWYVVGKQVEENVVQVAHGSRRTERSRRTFVVASPNWIGAPPAAERLQVKLRHGPQNLEARLARATDETWQVQLDEADPGVAPGQHAVFYDGENCLGGATIV
jgi:tRNA-specific 2-thiouridylase